MKVFKKFFIYSFLVCLITLSACSECDNENPRARVSNMGTEDVSVQVKTSGGNTENLNKIEPGKASEYRSYAPGEITYTIVLKNNEEIEEVVEMGFCSDYEIIINENNEIRTTSTNRD